MYCKRPAPVDGPEGVRRLLRLDGQRATRNERFPLYWRTMRKEPDYFGERDLPLIYVARKLKEALALESALTAAGVDYLVEPDVYTGGIVFRTERVGVFFYVAPEGEEAARRVLIEHGYRPQEPLGSAQR